MYSRLTTAGQFFCTTTHRSNSPPQGCALAIFFSSRTLLYLQLGWEMASSYAAPGWRKI